MKAIITVLLLLTSSVAFASECTALRHNGLSKDQQKVMYDSFRIGREKDLSYSLAAIAWRESSAGKYLINLDDPAAGVFMVTLKNAMSYLKWKDTPFNRNRVAQMLMEDFSLAAEFAMMNLQFWKSMYGNNWLKIWQSYNGGTSGSTASKDYAVDIARKIQVIKQCNWS